MLTAPQALVCMNNAVTIVKTPRSGPPAPHTAVGQQHDATATATIPPAPLRYSYYTRTHIHATSAQLAPHPEIPHTVPRGDAGCGISAVPWPRACARRCHAPQHGAVQTIQHTRGSGTTSKITMTNYAQAMPPVQTTTTPPPTHTIATDGSLYHNSEHWTPP